MKSLTHRILTPLSLLVLLFGGVSHAQYVPHIVQVKIPFEFTLNKKIFPAGEYSIVRTAPGRLDLRDVRGRFLVPVITHFAQSLEQSGSTKLLFSTAGGGHALTQLWIKGDLIGNELAAPKRTRAVASRNSPQPLAMAGGANK